MARTPTRRAPVPAPPLRPAQIVAARRRARDRSLRRDAVVLVVVIVGLAVTWAVREVPDERFPLVAERTAQLDAAYADVRAGDLTVGTEPTEVADGITGVRVEREAGDRWVLASTAADECYALWWDEAGLRRTRTVPPTLPCEAASRFTSTHPTAYDRLGRGGPEGGDGDVWEGVRPDPVRFRLWFLPALIALGGLGLAALVRMSIALLTGDDPRNVRR
jgi:hypothetical protein